MKEGDCGISDDLRKEGNPQLNFDRSREVNSCSHVNTPILLISM